MKRLTQHLFSLLAIIALLAMSIEVGYSQGAACLSATSLTVNGACSGNVNINDVTINDPTATTCTSPTLDGWFTFAAIATSTTVTFTNSSTRDPEIFVYSGACGVSGAGLTYINCVNATTGSGNETITFATTIGSTYFVRIGRVTGTSGALNGNTCISSPTAPNCATISTPANAATGVCYSSTTLNWTAPATGTAPTGYKLYFGTDAAATNLVNGTNIGNVLTYNPGILLGNTTYYWKIVPTNAIGDASGCSIWSFTTGSNVPACATTTTPANAATGICFSTVTLNWTAPSGCATATGYKLYFGTDAAATNITNGTNIGNVLTYNPGTLLASTTYYWKIVATNANGDAVGCTIKSFTTSASCPFNQQNGSFTTCGGTYYDAGGSAGNYANSENSTITFCPSVVGQKVQVTFSAFTTESGLDLLYIYNGPSTGSPLIATLSGSTLPACAYTSSDASGCLTFRFVSDGSITYSGWTALLSCVSGPPLPSCAVITTPANAAINLCNFSTNLNWTAPSGCGIPSGYLLYFGTNAAATNIVNGTNIGNVLTYNPGVLAISTTYYWKIVPTNSTGNAVGCSIYSFTTGAACPYTQQNGSFTSCGGTYYSSNGSTGSYANNENSTITFCPSIVGQKVQVTFSAFTTENSLDLLYIYNGPTTGSPLIANLSGSTLPACAYTSSDAGGCLTFRFVSDGSITYSGWTASLSCVTAPPLPSCAAITTPTNAATYQCNLSTTLNWTAPSGCGIPSGYLLYFGTDAAATNIVNGTNIGNVLTYNPGVLAISTTYYWKIVPTNSAGNAAGCSIYSFTTGAACPYTQQNGSFTSCGGAYQDSGGAGNYASSENNTITFCPSVAGQYVSVTFSSFVLESGFDNLTVYNGSSVASPLLYTLTGSTIPCQITSSAVGGCLTFHFSSDGSVVYAGWDATLSCVVSPAGPLAGSICANAPAISLPYTATAQTTACYGNDYSNSSTGSCGTLYESGEDRIYSYTASGPECISITIANANTSYIGFQVYSGCPGAAGTTCIGNSGGATAGSLSGSVVLPAAGTYYLVVDTYASPSSANYDISVSSYGSSVVNDLPCNATLMTLGASESGDNSCAGSTGEPAAPACWTTGNRNTVWYKVAAPASGSLRIKTYLGTLTNTQIAVYSGACGAGMTVIATACNDDASTCAGLTNFNSELYLTGLTSGTTYYIAVDGSASLIGTFSILAIDGNTTFPPIMGMDCMVPNLVCAQGFSVSNPGYAGFGNTCDLPYPAPSGSCLFSAERNIVWYTIPINAAGNLQFDIVPNDFLPSTMTYTDYDFGIWKIAGAGAVTCSQIASGSALPLRCNYSYLGLTGCFGSVVNTANTAILSISACPQCYPPGTYIANPFFNGAYETQIPVASGDIYLLGVSNYTSSTSGFSIDFGTSPIGYAGTSATSIIWTGGTDTDPSKPSNWGGCNIPSCSIDATIAPFINQPVLTSNQTVKSLTIQAGARLTINAGVTLTVCGDFTNLGFLVMAPTATILFNNTSSHAISGFLTGINALGNLTITQSAGSVNLLNDIDIKGTFTTTNAMSVFNTNANYVKVAKNFSNSSGNTTYSGTGTTGTLEFNGSSAQTYSQGSSQLDLNNVVMNHTSAGLTLLTNMYLKSGTSNLTLTAGKIITNAFEVNVANTSPGCVSAGNTISFVQGNLRRYLSPTGSFNFPVGHATKGYQLANLSFTAPTSIGNLLARFDPWTITPFTQGGTECGVTYNIPAEDNGLWTITADANPLTGTYNTKLYPTNATNSAVALGWTVMKSDAGEAGPWVLNGNCNLASTATFVERDSMIGFSKFGVAQSVAPLPIELISFTGKNEGKRNLLEWTTATETNNAYFDVEHSSEANHFVSFATIAGAGNSTHSLNYSTYDNSPWEGITYYRLKQTDYNGMQKYSDVISVDMHTHEVGFNIINTYSSSPESGLEVTVNCTSNCELSFEMYDMIGNLVFSSKQNTTGTNVKVVIPTYRLSKGIYLLKAYNGEQIITKKIVN
ncbi:MAG: CUB domain-containing protein [Bacteroidota bacterium]